MKHGSLFSGLGGFDLATQWMGWENMFHCELNEFGRKILTHYWPEAISYEDIKKTDFTIWRGQIDIITGGEPCQPSSVAGLGKGTEDNRYLWPEKFRVIRELQPPWVVNENVDGTITNGILDIKIDDLESEGYTCQAYIIPAESVGALHKRDRVWLVAHNPDFNSVSRKPSEVSKKEGREKIQKRNNVQHSCESVDLWSTYSNADFERFKEQHYTEKSRDEEEGFSRYFGFGSNPHGNIPRDFIKSAIVRMLNGLPEGMDYTERNKRIQTLGNAIVPQVAYQIFKAIETSKTIPA